MKKDTQLFLVNRGTLNSFMAENAISDRSVAEKIAKSLPSNTQAAAVKIGALRKGEALAANEAFLNQLEKGLGMKKGALVGKAVTKTELVRIKALKENQRQNIVNRLDVLIFKSDSETVVVEKKFLREIAAFL